MLLQNVIPRAINSFSNLINLDISTIKISIINNEYTDFIAIKYDSDNSIVFNLYGMIKYLYETKRLESEEEIRAFILRIVGHELCHINQLMVGNIEADCDIHTIKIIESNKQYFINTYGYIDTHKFSSMQYVVDNYKEK